VLERLRPHDLELGRCLPILRGGTAVTDDGGSWTLVQVLPLGYAVLDPAGAALVVALLDTYVRSERLISPQARRLRSALARVASSSGHADTDPGVPDAPWAHDEIGTTEAAEILSISVRHTRRLADAAEFGPSRMIGGRRLVSRAEVEAYRLAHRNID
jgi:excisionase family DNA binding protein